MGSSNGLPEWGGVYTIRHNGRSRTGESKKISGRVPTSVKENARCLCIRDGDTFTVDIVREGNRKRRLAREGAMIRRDRATGKSCCKVNH